MVSNMPQDQMIAPIAVKIFLLFFKEKMLNKFICIGKPENARNKCPSDLLLK